MKSGVCSKCGKEKRLWDSGICDECQKESRKGNNFFDLFENIPYSNDRSGEAFIRPTSTWKKEKTNIYKSPDMKIVIASLILSFGMIVSTYIYLR